MFATLLGDLPRPPLPADAPPEELVREALAAQAAAGLEPLTDGGLWGTGAGDPVARWRATAELTGLAVKAVITGPYTELARAGGERAATADALASAAEAGNRVLRALAGAGCPLVEVHEPAVTGLGEAARGRFADAHRRLLDGVTGTHLSLAITGGNADHAGIGTLLAAPYHSLALDLVAGPDNWRLAVAAPPAVGIIAGAMGAGERADESLEILVWAAGYAASTGGRGFERVGLATAGSLSALPWDVALRRMERLGTAARLVAGTAEERAAALDPRAVSIRSAALGRSGIRRRPATSRAVSGRLQSRRGPGSLRGESPPDS